LAINARTARVIGSDEKNPEAKKLEGSGCLKCFHQFWKKRRPVRDQALSKITVWSKVTLECRRLLKSGSQELLEGLKSSSFVCETWIHSSPTVPPIAPNRDAFVVTKWRLRHISRDLLFPEFADPTMSRVSDYVRSSSKTSTGPSEFWHSCTFNAFKPAGIICVDCLRIGRARFADDLLNMSTDPVDFLFNAYKATAVVRINSLIIGRTGVADSFVPKTPSNSDTFKATVVVCSDSLRIGRTRVAYNFWFGVASRAVISKHASKGGIHTGETAQIIVWNGLHPERAGRAGAEPKIVEGWITAKLGKGWTCREVRITAKLGKGWTWRGVRVKIGNE